MENENKKRRGGNWIQINQSKAIWNSVVQFSSSTKIFSQKGRKSVLGAFVATYVATNKKPLTTSWS